MTNSQFHSLLKGGTLDKLRSAVKSAKGGGFKDDEGYWRPTVDKAGNGSATIRFLPAPPPETVPFGMFYRHAFKGPTGAWYIENCRTTINENDPCVEYTSRLYATGDSTLKAQGSAQSRKLTYVANIYVVKDVANPEAEGKVFLFRFGRKIFEKIEGAANPKFAGDVEFDPFHVIEGANFKLRQKKQAGFPNYDDSSFEAPSPLLGGNEAAIMTVLAGLKSVSELSAPDKFKSYEELKKRLDKVMGFDTAVYLTPADVAARGGRTGFPAASSEASAENTAPTPVARPWTPPVVDDDESESSDLLDRFDDE